MRASSGRLLTGRAILVTHLSRRNRIRMRNHLIGSKQTRIPDSNRLTSTSGQASKAWMRCPVYREAICPVMSCRARMRIESGYKWILRTSQLRISMSTKYETLTYLDNSKRSRYISRKSVMALGFL